MTEIEALEAIYLRWAEGWAALHPSAQSDPNYAPYCFRGEVFSRDQLGVLGVWARVDVRHSTRDQTTMGTIASEEVDGNVFVQLFGPLDQGAGTLARLADDARTVLGRKRLGDLVLFTGETRAPVEDHKTGFSMVVVVVKFRYEHQSTSG